MEAINLYDTVIVIIKVGVIRLSFVSLVIRSDFISVMSDSQKDSLNRTYLNDGTHFDEITYQDGFKKFYKISQNHLIAFTGHVQWIEFLLKEYPVDEETESIEIDEVTKAIFSRTRLEEAINLNAPFEREGEQSNVVIVGKDEEDDIIINHLSNMEKRGVMTYRYSLVPDGKLMCIALSPGDLSTEQSGEVADMLDERVNQLENPDIENVQKIQKEVNDYVASIDDSVNDTVFADSIVFN